MLLNTPHATPAAVTMWLHSKLSLDSSAILNVLMKYPELFCRSREVLDVTLAWFVSNGVGIALLSRKPEVLACNFSSPVVQIKVCFFTQVMGKHALELLTNKLFLKYSLTDRIGPRWDFHLLYCKDQPFMLSSKMDTTDEVFLKRLVSSFLDAECEAQEMTRQQMYDKVKTHWKQDEGKKWDVPGGEEGKE